MNHFVLCIGSNLEPRVERVADARDWLIDILKNHACSNIYETPEIHGVGRPYMNMVCEGYSDISFSRLSQMCKDYEVLAGRDEMSRSRGDVPIDIDVVVVNDKVVRDKDFRQKFFWIGAKQINLPVFNLETAFTE